MVNLANEERLIYICPVCADVITWPVVSTCSPNRLHWHVGEDGQEYMVQMELAPVAQLEERLASNQGECEFESHRGCQDEG